MACCWHGQLPGRASVIGGELQAGGNSICLCLTGVLLWPPRRPHCTATAIAFIYSFSGNSAASAPISTFMCLWAIYIFPGSVYMYIFPPAEQADPSWEYIICSQTHECRNWDWDPDIPFLGIFVSNFRHFVFAVWTACLHSRDSYPIDVSHLYFKIFCLVLL